MRVAAACLVLLALGCSRPQHPYAPDLVDNFLRACRARGGTEAGCTCAIDRVRERYTEDEYRALEARVARRDEAAARELANLTADCRGR